MALSNLTKDELRDYFERWLAVKDRIPYGYEVLVKKIKPELPKSRITKVKHMQTVDPEILTLLEQVVREKDIAFQKRHKIRIGNPINK